MKTASKSNVVGKLVKYVVNGQTQFWGRAEYVAAGWVGIRQCDGRLDEARLSHVEFI